MPAAVDQLPLGPLETNCYLVRADRGASEALIVDPSGPATDIRLALASRGARCVAILVTHGHFDHIISLADLVEATGAFVYGPAGERRIIEDPSIFTPPGMTVRPAGADVWLDGGETVDAAGISFAVTLVPGHSPAHLAFYADGHLFSGDVLFANSVGRPDLPGGDWNVLQASIASFLDAYPPDTIVHPGHGRETTLAAELAANPFLADLRAARAGQ